MNLISSFNENIAFYVDKTIIQSFLLTLVSIYFSCPSKQSKLKTKTICFLQIPTSYSEPVTLVNQVEKFEFK